MTGLDGISSLQKALSALKTTDSATVKDAAPTSATQAASGSANPKTSTPSTGRLDHTSLSAAAQVTGTSDVRLTKVAELRQAISSGSYNVPAHEVASRIVDHLLG